MIISNSDIMSLQKCEMRFVFERLYNLRPREYPEPMELGIFGHKILEAVYLDILNGGDFDSASAAATQVVSNNIVEKGTTPLTVNQSKLLRHVLAFLSYSLSMPWQVVAVEQGLQYEVNEKLTFGFTPDIVFRWTAGPKKGLYFVLDWKFVGQYWNKRKVDMFQQIPKYAIYRNKLIPDEKIAYGGVVMFNTRAPEYATGNGLFLLKWIPMNKEKLARIEFENERGMYKAALAYNLGKEFKGIAVRTVNNHECNLCIFADDLCPADLEGRDTSRIMKLNYVENDYGYN